MGHMLARLLGCCLLGWVGWARVEGQAVMGVATAAGPTQHPDHQPGQALPLRPPAPPHKLWEEACITCSHGDPALGTPHLWVALA